ncbi:MAG: hypothetical protein JWO44_987 [Bacteroidetes bacterium]|nr:hypothetical protein [Bacteroidota bacterium]
MLKQEYKIIFRKYFRGRFEDLEEIFEILKSNGASMADCVKILIFELDLPLKTADEIVINSKVWGHLKKDTKELRDVFYLSIKGRNKE